MLRNECNKDLAQPILNLKIIWRNLKNTLIPISASTPEILIYLVWGKAWRLFLSFHIILTGQPGLRTSNLQAQKAEKIRNGDLHWTDFSEFCPT